MKKQIKLSLIILTVLLFAVGLKAQPPVTNDASKVKIIVPKELAVFANQNAESTKSCCPPFNYDTMLNLMFWNYSGTAFSSPYRVGVSFLNQPNFKSQMQTYLNYVRTIDPTINTITISWSLFDNNSNQIGQTIYFSWNNNTNPAGNPLISPSYSTLNQFYTYTASGLPLQSGIWYRVRARIYLEDGKTFFPATCSESIADKYFCQGNCVLHKGVKETNNLVITKDGKEFIKNPEIQVIDNKGKQVVTPKVSRPLKN